MDCADIGLSTCMVLLQGATYKSAQSWLNMHCARYLTIGGVVCK